LRIYKVSSVAPHNALFIPSLKVRGRPLRLRCFMQITVYLFVAGMMSTILHLSAIVWPENLMRDRTRRDHNLATLVNQKPSKTPTCEAWLFSALFYPSPPSASRPDTNLDHFLHRRSLSGHQKTQYPNSFYRWETIIRLVLLKSIFSTKKSTFQAILWPN